jgi:hypothetical protein
MKFDGRPTFFAELLAYAGRLRHRTSVGRVIHRVGESSRQRPWTVAQRMA